MRGGGGGEEAGGEKLEGGSWRGEAGETRGKQRIVPRTQQESTGFLTEGEGAERCFLMRQKSAAPPPGLGHEQDCGLRNAHGEA